MRNAKAKSADPKRFYDNSLIQQVNRDHAAKLFPGENELPRSKLRGIGSNRSDNRSELRGINPTEIK